MEASPNQNTQPIREPERTLFIHIDEVLAAYDRYVLDHQLALEGIVHSDALTVRNLTEPV